MQENIPVQEKKAKRKEISTRETQELIYQRRVLRRSITKGVSRGELIDRINAITVGRGRLAKEETS
jgi:hypothetical protein